MNKIKNRIILFSVAGLILGLLTIQSFAQRYNSDDLIGTYELDARKSENVRDIVESATKNSRVTNADKKDLENKLLAPRTIAIDIRGRVVTLSTSRANPVEFNADGRTRTSTHNDGSTVRVRATLRGSEMIVSSVGGETDYTLTFTSIDDGKGLRVTRRITTGYLRYTVFADSIYNKTDSFVRIGSSGTSDKVYSTSDDRPNYIGNDPSIRESRIGEFIVPKGEVLSGILENKISTKASQNNDRFRIRVQSPGKYRDAIIEGYLSGIERTGRVLGRSKLTMKFETIKMPKGRVYDFAGVLRSVVDKNGKTIKADLEGEAKGKSRSKKTLTRAGIGAGLGAIVGGILGGSKGAAIGATIGGGLGASSSILSGKQNLELEKGAAIKVESTAPNR